MNLETWSTWARWLLFLPFAVLAMIVTHFLIAIAFSGNEDKASVFGFDVEGTAAQWINTIKFHVLARSLEPWAFVAAGGITAPPRLVPAVALAVVMVLLHFVAPTLYVVKGAPTSTIGLMLLAAGMGIAGSVAGVFSVLRYKGVIKSGTWNHAAA